MKIRTLLTIVMMTLSSFVAAAATTTWPASTNADQTFYGAITFAQPIIRPSLINPILYAGDTNTTGIFVTTLWGLGEGSDTAIYTNGAILYWPSDTSGGRKGIVINGPFGNYEQLYWTDHGGGVPEMVTTIQGLMSWYFTGWQFGNPSGGNGNEYIWHVSGLTPYIKGGVTNYNLMESQNLIQYDAWVYTNAIPIPPTINYLGNLWTNQNMSGGWPNGVGWTKAGSLGDGFPSFHFRATSNNGSGAFVWYEKFAQPLPGTAQGWPNNALNYDSSVEAMSLTVGPDRSIKGLTIVGPVNAKALVITNTAAPVVVNSSGTLWNSNSVLYWVTSTKTNMISDGR